MTTNISPTGPHADQSEFLAALEDLAATLDTPIVEGETAMWAGESHEFLQAFATLFHQRGIARITELRRLPPEVAGARLAALEQEEARLSLQLSELIFAAEALQRRAEKVGPDEKRLTSEVETFTRQASQFVLDVRQQEQSFLTWIEAADRGVADAAPHVKSSSPRGSVKKK